MSDDDKKPDQIPLLQDIVYDTSLPLKPPPRPRRPGTKEQARKSKAISEHGPEYDPDTLDLFKQRSADFQADASALVEEMVAEYSREIITRLRDELTSQLNQILDDLTDEEKAEQQRQADEGKE